jgi:hypothetical protein
MNSIDEAEVFDSMKKVLRRINLKLEDEEIMGNTKDQEYFRRRKTFVEEKLKDWEEFMNQ